MTTVTYYEENDEISVRIKGHAGYDEKGSDIVCAAISTLGQTLLAYLMRSSITLNEKALYGVMPKAQTCVSHSIR